MSDLTVTQATDLNQLAKRINEEHAKAEAAMRDGLSHAVEAGKLLIEAKTQHKHGGWLKWLKANFASTPRTAQGYIWLSSRMLDEANTKRVSHLGYSAAVKLLREEERQELRAEKRAANEEAVKRFTDDQAALARNEPVVTEERIGPAGWLHRVTKAGIGGTQECIDPEYLEAKKTEIDEELYHVLANANEGLMVAQQGLGDLEKYCRQHGKLRKDLHSVSEWYGIEHPCEEILERWEGLSESLAVAFDIVDESDAKSGIQVPECRERAAELETVGA